MTELLQPSRPMLFTLWPTREKVCDSHPSLLIASPSVLEGFTFNFPSSRGLCLCLCHHLVIFSFPLRVLLWYFMFFPGHSNQAVLYTIRQKKELLYALSHLRSDVSILRVQLPACSGCWNPPPKEQQRGGKESTVLMLSVCKHPFSHRRFLTQASDAAQDCGVWLGLLA